MDRSKLQYLVSALVLAVLTACGPDVCPPDVSATMRKSPKRGVSFNFSNVEDLPLLSPSVSWAYNWGNTQNDNAALWFDSNGMDYCPMVWNNRYNPDAIRNYVALHPDTKYLLAYNEPNLTDQANMTPAQAAEQWGNVVALARELNLKLVSPAMNYGTLSGYSDPIKWLDEFFAQPNVSADDIYAISVHCYMASPSALQGYIERFRKYNKPVWLTEFCAWDGMGDNPNNQVNYMVAALNYLEQSDLVERYAWFIPRAGGSVNSYPYQQLLSHTSPVELTPLGQIYTQFSSFDKKAYLPLAQGVYPHQYVGLSTDNIPMQVTDDNKLYISGLQAGMWLDYQVVTAENKPLQIAYSSLGNCRMCVYVDGVAQTFIDLPKTADMSAVTTLNTGFVPAKGYHTLRLELLNGSMFYYSIKQ